MLILLYYVTHKIFLFIQRLSGNKLHWKVELVYVYIYIYTHTVFVSDLWFVMSLQRMILSKAFLRWGAIRRAIWGVIRRVTLRVILRVSWRGFSLEDLDFIYVNFLQLIWFSFKLIILLLGFGSTWIKHIFSLFNSLSRLLRFKVLQDCIYSLVLFQLNYSLSS